jgi:hypothetical protein
MDYELSYEALVDRAIAANDLRNNSKKFKHPMRVRACIVNALFALQYWAGAGAPS